MFISIFCLIIFIVIARNMDFFLKKSLSVKNVLIGIAIFYVAVFSITYIFMIIPIHSDGEDTPADGYEINSYNVKLKVHENNLVNVTEDFNINYTREGKHGIYKFIPTWLEYTPKTGRKIKRRSVISNLTSNEEYSLYTVKQDKKKIALGSSETTVPMGIKNYTINYDYNMGKDPFVGYDEFIFHVYGDFWGTEIKNPTLTVEMPSSIKNQKIKFFNDKLRKEDITDRVIYKVEDNKLIVTNINGALYKSLTVDIELPEGYFKGGTYNYGYSSLIKSLIIILLTLITFLMWRKYGKDYPKKLIVTQFDVPDNLSSAEVGYIYGKQKSKKLTISLIVELAAKGYIKIDQDDKKRILITDTVDNVDNYKRKVTVEKLKDIDDTLTNEEKKFLTPKFEIAKNNIFTITSNYEKYDKNKESLIKKGFIKEISNEYKTKEFLKNIEKKRKEKLDNLNEYEKVVYNYFKNNKGDRLNENSNFYLSFSAINTLLEENLKDLIKDKQAKKMQYIALAINYIVTVLSLSSFFSSSDLSPNMYFLYYLSFACIAINLFFIIIMTRKTEYGEEISSKVKGFKDFLENVEKDKINELVEKYPDYFYRVLPYTYVFGISKKWIKKFEDIKMPEIDMGDFDFSNISSITRDITYPEPVYSSSGGSSSSSGCSSCGGGCSSCGGGCSSCGGGGSW